MSHSVLISREHTYNHDRFEPHFYKVKLELAGVCINSSFFGISDVFEISFLSNVELYKIPSNKK